MLDEELEPIFKALGDAKRRQILDILKENPGINVTELTKLFVHTRFGVMKHMRLLEKANLVTQVKKGKFRHFYLNAIPIQMIHDRWLSKYSRHFATGLTRLKYDLEGKENFMNKEIKQVYVMYIRTSLDKLWDTLVKAELTPEWFAGMAVRFEPKVGAALTYEAKGPDNKDMALVKGKVLELEVQKNLAYSFSLQVNETVMADKESRVKYELESVGDSIKLTVTHDQFESETPSYQGTSQGWPMHLSNLKSFIETGKALSLPQMH